MRVERGDIESTAKDCHTTIEGRTAQCELRVVERTAIAPDELTRTRVERDYSIGCFGDEHDPAYDERCGRQRARRRAQLCSPRDAQVVDVVLVDEIEAAVAGAREVSVVHQPGIGV